MHPNTREQNDENLLTEIITTTTNTPKSSSVLFSDVFRVDAIITSSFSPSLSSTVAPILTNHTEIDNDSENITDTPSSIEEGDDLFAGEIIAGGAAAIIIAPTTAAPIATTVPTITPTTNSIIMMYLNITLQLDEYPTETGWSLVCNNNDNINKEESFSSSTESVASNYIDNTEPIQLSHSLRKDDPCYFTITNEAGDGLCCGGNYALSALVMDDSVLQLLWTYDSYGSFTTVSTIEFYMNSKGVVNVVDS